MILIRQELLAFLRGGINSLLFVGLTTLSWGIMMGSYPLSSFELTTLLWVLFYALVTSAGITSTVFIRERQSGNLEILLVSGVSRKEIALSKIAFSFGVTSLMGGVTLLVATLFSVAVFGESVTVSALAKYYVVYLFGAALMVSSSAWLALVLDNPRTVYILNFLLLSVISVLFITLATFFESYGMALLVIFIPLPLLFVWLTYRQLFKESVIRRPLL